MRSRKLHKDRNIFFSVDNLRIIDELGITAQEIIKEIEEVRNGKIYFRHDLSSEIIINSMLFMVSDEIGLLYYYKIAENVFFYVKMF